MSEEKEPNARAMEAARDIDRIMQDERYTARIREWMIAMRVQQEINRTAKAKA